MNANARLQGMVGRLRAALVPFCLNYRDSAPLNTFDFNGHQLRTVVIEGEPWFAAPDVAGCLGLANPESMCRPVDRHQLRTQSLRGKRGNRMVTMLSESALYSVTMRAQRSKPGVVKFQDWVNGEVLPSIRKTGGYLLNEAARTTAHADNLMAFGA